MKIVVLGGGDSPERDVSIRSARAVASGLRTAGFEITELDPIDGLSALDNTQDIVFPILHGGGGEDGTVQAELEKRNLPFLGSDSQASALCFDKHLTRQALIKAGIKVAEGAEVTEATYAEHPLAKRAHVLKVSKGGSSIGTYIVRDTTKIDAEKVKGVFKVENVAVLEELIEGKEITVPVLDKQALPVVEVIPPEGQEFDYENKYNGKTTELCPPRSLDKKTCEAAQRLAEKVHNVLGARHLSRTDIMIDKAGQLIVLELNTMPGMTEQSFFPLAAKVHGLPMPELVTRFVDLVKRDYELN